jgi:hypothetical protein
MSDSTKDEDYAQGVHDGQHDDGFERFSGSFSRGFQSDEYRAGYEYGETHDPSESSGDSDSSGGSSNTDNSSNCFITTACIKHQGLPDDCSELQALRKFRDTVLLETKQGQLLVGEYYNIAPLIVASIEQSNTDKAVVWGNIYSQILEVVKLIEINKNDEVIEKYRNVILNLKKEFITK